MGSLQATFCRRKTRHEEVGTAPKSKTGTKVTLCLTRLSFLRQIKHNTISERLNESAFLEP